MPEDEPAPKAPGHLVLTEKRLEWLVELALLRITEVSREVGREMDGTITPDSWMAELDRNKKSYDKDLEWRTGMPTTIFAEGQNITWGASSARVRLLSARIRDALMGTRPFFGCMTARNGRPKLTKAAESYLQERIEAGNVTGSIRSGIRLALALNQAVLKTTYRVDRTPFTGPAQGVFVDPFGNPQRTKAGELIYEKDDAIPDPNTEGLMRLVKDPTFTFTEGQYGHVDFDSLEQEMTHYEGAESVVLHFLDFLCPLNVETVHDADINVHLYHRTLGQLGLSYGDVETAHSYFSWRNDSRVGADQPIRIRGEQDEVPSMVIQKILVAEVYIRCQIHDDEGDPREVELMLVLDVDAKRAIFYDYLGNHMAKRPFAVIPGVQKVDGRWYGIGVFTMMAHPDMYTDAMLNRSNKKDGKTASVTVAHRKAINEWKGAAPIRIGSSEILTFAPDWDPQRSPIVRYDLLENAELGMELAREVRQAADNEFGIQSAAAASSLDQNRSNTATGVNNIERDANLVSRDNMYDIAKAIEEVLWQAVDMELEHMDETVLAFSQDGSDLATLNRSEIRSLERQVKLLLTKSRSSEMVSSAQSARAAWIQYMRLSPVEQFYGRPFFVTELKGYEVDDADDRLPEVTQQQMEAWVKAQSEPKKPEDKPVSTSIATKYTDLARSEQIQLLAKEGITPAPPQEVAAKQAQSLASEVTVKQAAPPHFPEANPPKEPKP